MDELIKFHHFAICYSICVAGHTSLPEANVTSLVLAISLLLKVIIRDLSIEH